MEQKFNHFINTYTRWILVGLMALALVLSALFFQKQSLRLDEAQSIYQTSRTPLKILNLIAQDVHVPLYHMLLHAWQVFFGNGVVALRMLSLLFFLLSIPMIYLLGKTSYDKRVGLFASLLLTISPFMNWYGNEIRMYSLFVFIVLVNQYFFVNLFRHPEKKFQWLGFFLSAVFGIYTHYFFFLILITNGLFYLLNKKLFIADAFKRLAITAGGLFVLFLPWLVYVYSLGKASNTQPSLIAPTTVNLFNTFSQFLFGFQTDHLNTILVSLWPLTVLLGFLALRKNRKIEPVTFYFLACFLIPNILAFAISFVRPIYLTRYLIFTMPSMYFILSWLFARYPKALGVACRIIIVLAMLGTLVYESIDSATPVKENYREASNYLTEHASASDIIVLSAPFTIYPISYYYKGSSDIQTLPIWDQEKYGPIPPFSNDKLVKDIETLKGQHQNLWLLLSYDQGYQKDIENYFAGHFEQLQKKEFSAGMTLYEYKLRYDTDPKIVPKKR